MLSYYIPIFLLTIVLFLLSSKLKRDRFKRLHISMIVFSILAIVCRLIFKSYPDLEYRLIPFSWYPHVRPIWYFVPVALFFGSVQHFITSKAISSLIRISFLLLIFFQVKIILTDSQKNNLYGEVNAEGICFQSSPYSCGASSAVMLLHKYGVNKTEEELAGMSNTSPVIGADEFAIVKALNEIYRSPNSKFQIVRAGVDSLTQNTPAMALVKLQLFTDHWVVIESLQNDSVSVLDPLAGRVHLSVTEFDKQWRNILITLR